MKYIRLLVKERGINPCTVADPGAGVGAFSESAFKMWPDATIFSVDINLVTLGLLAASPGFSADKTSKQRLHLWHGDFLTWIQSEWQSTQSPRLVFGNPPYTRHQLLGAEEKNAAGIAAGPLAPSGRSGLSTYFIAASLNALSRDDSLCLLLPINWLEADYARPVREHLWSQRYRPIELHIFPDDEHIFPNAQVAAMVLFVGSQAETRQDLRIYELSRSDDCFTANLSIEDNRDGATPRTLMPSGIRIDRSSAGHAEGDTVPLKRVATVRRGVATGKNTFFLRTEEQVSGLPERVYTPAIARLRDIDSDELTEQLHKELRANGERCWMLQITKDDRSDPAIDALLTTAEEEGIDDAFLCRARTPWYTLEKISTPHIVISPMSKRTFRVVINTFGAIPTNTLYGLRLTEQWDSPDNRRRLAGWLRSEQGQRALSTVARKHGDRLLKLEPKALLSVRIPADLLLDVSERSGQLAAF